MNILTGVTKQGVEMIFNTREMVWETKGHVGRQHNAPAGPMIHISAQVNAEVHGIDIVATRLIPA